MMPQQEGTKPATPFSFFERSPKSPSHEVALPDKSSVEIVHDGPYEVDGLGRPNELDGMPRSELQWNPRVVEMDSTTTTQER